MPKCYASLNQLKSPGYLNIQGITGNDYDTDLLRILENASEEIDHLTFRYFSTWEGTQYYDGAGVTFIPNDDILSISTLQLDTDGDGTYETTLTATTDYLLYPLGGPSLYPKIMIKFAMNSGIGYFASGIRAGIKIIGIFGHGDGYSATPYTASGIVVNTGGITNSATTHTLATGGGLAFSQGNTIRIGSEQIYITSISLDTLTFTRGANGTTAAAHTAGDAISLYRYPGPVVESALILAANWWKQRENPTVFKIGNSITGEYQITEDIEKILTKRLNHHIKRKLV